MIFCSKTGSAGVASGGPDSAVRSGSDTPVNKLDPGISAVLRDTAYGSEGEQKLDLSLVAGRNAHTPLVVLLHGGAWSGGDKKDLQSTVDFFLSQGVNVANLNYRLTNNSSGSVRWTGILSDVRDAIALLHAQSSRLQIRSADYVAFGFSAGAHLALLHSYSYDSSRLVSAVIGFGTPTKFNDLAWKVNPFLGVARQALPPLTGQTFSTDTSNIILKELSPYFSPDYKPTLLVHGDQDKIVPYSQSLLMSVKLQAAGVMTSFITLPHSGHMGEGAATTDYNKMLQACAAWVKKYSD